MGLTHCLAHLATQLDPNGEKSYFLPYKDARYANRNGHLYIIKRLENYFSSPTFTNLKPIP